MEKVRLLAVDGDPPFADLVATVGRYGAWEAVARNIVVFDLMLPGTDSHGEDSGGGTEKDGPQLIHTVRGVEYAVRRISE
ncbi:hypothetical protein [Streptomyces sp. NPDC017991]|uniref:hypothetical protein n=1 Tax=Streptomyces sp. NPDC017991 TaxID=3365026 RepID=UPI0037922A0C